MNPFEELIAETISNEITRSQSFDLSNSGSSLFQQNAQISSVSSAIGYNPAHMADFLGHRTLNNKPAQKLETIYENLPSSKQNIPPSKEQQKSDKKNLSMHGSKKKRRMSNQRLTSRDEDLLLQDFSRNVTTKSWALFIGNAAVVSAIPLWLFWRIHQMDITSYFIHFIIGTAISTYFLNSAYQNMKFILKHKIAQKREEAINREITKLFANDKNANKKDKDDRVLTRKNEVADFEATTFSIFYNNAFYLVCLIVLSFFVFKNFSPTVNYLFSVGLSTAIVFLFSTGEK
ncbi:unnamed protein product [Rotaria sp. Silwood2]|nr:unnamed protein product [Rotaria sp. Silwood2]CAF4204114.1 unnamed protein product [Rotaria sp. Silwood2]